MSGCHNCKYTWCGSSLTAGASRRISAPHQAEAVVLNRQHHSLRTARSRRFSTTAGFTYGQGAGPPISAALCTTNHSPFSTFGEYTKAPRHACTASTTWSNSYVNPGSLSLWFSFIAEDNEEDSACHPRTRLPTPIHQRVHKTAPSHTTYT